MAVPEYLLRSDIKKIQTTEQSQFTCRDCGKGLTEEEDELSWQLKYMSKGFLMCSDCFNRSFRWLND